MRSFWWTMGLGLAALGATQLSCTPRSSTDTTTTSHGDSDAPHNDELCSRLRAMAPFIHTAKKAAAMVARRSWPSWSPGKVPALVTDTQGNRWVFFADSAGAYGQPGASCSTSEGTVFLLEGQRREDQFAAAASKEGPVVYLRISAPARAPFPYLDWVSIFVHESFHCYQLSGPAFLELFRLASEGTPAMRRLQSMYESEGWLRRNVDAELAIMGDILREDDVPAAEKVANLLELRQRHQKTLASAEPGLSKVEGAAEIVEGTARFVEYEFYKAADAVKAVRALDPGTALTEDTSVVRGLSVSGSSYYYATGFGLSHLAARLVPQWQERLPGEGFDALLADAIQMNSRRR